MNLKFIVVILCMFEVFGCIYANISPVQDIGDSKQKEKEIQDAENHLFKQILKKHKEMKWLEKKLDVIQYVLWKATGVAWFNIKPHEDLNSITKFIWKKGRSYEKQIDFLKKEKSCLLMANLTVCKRTFNKRNEKFFKREKLSYPGNGDRHECQKWTMKVVIDGKDRYFEMEFKKCFVTKHLDDGSTIPSIVYVKASDSSAEKIFIAYAYEQKGEDEHWEMKNDDIPGGSMSVAYRFEAYLPMDPAPKLIGEK